MVVLLSLVVPSEADGPQISIGEYLGTHTGKNGGITLEVAQDGSTVTSFAALTLPGTCPASASCGTNAGVLFDAGGQRATNGSCSWDAVSDKPLAIVDGHFSLTSDQLTVLGSFSTDRPGSASGSVEVHTSFYLHPSAPTHDSTDECDVNIRVDWSAKARNPAALAIASTPTATATVAVTPTDVPTSTAVPTPTEAPTQGPDTAPTALAAVAPAVRLPVAPTNACLHSQRGCPLDDGRAMQAVLGTPDEVHGWHITLSTASDLTVVLSNLQVEYDLHVVGPDGTPLYDSSRYGSDDDIATLTGLRPGEYTIYINSPFGDTSDVPYVLQANVTTNDGP